MVFWRRTPCASGNSTSAFRVSILEKASSSDVAVSRSLRDAITVRVHFRQLSVCSYTTPQDASAALLGDRPWPRKVPVWGKR